ncbi:MAG: 50S ribosomal protein L22 [Patescibacteria group bacterium]
MEIRAKLRYARMAPRKMRLVADLVRGQKIDKAFLQLSFSKKKSAPIIAKLLKSAVSNARHNYKIDTENKDLYIKEIRVDEGPSYKRYRPAARGRTHPYKKRTSHITVVLKEQPKVKTYV